MHHRHRHQAPALLTISLAFALLALSDAKGLARADDGIRLYTSPALRLFTPDPQFGVNRGGPAVGIDTGGPVASWLDVQGSLGYGRATDNANTVRQFTLGVNGLVMLSRERFRPFLMLGVGAVNTRVDATFFQGASTAPYLGIGGGFQYQLDERLSVQADVRRNLAFLREHLVPGAARGFTSFASVGLNYWLDSPASTVGLIPSVMASPIASDGAVPPAPTKVAPAATPAAPAAAAPMATATATPLATATPVASTLALADPASGVTTAAEGSAATTSPGAPPLITPIAPPELLAQATLTVSDLFRLNKATLRKPPAALTELARTLVTHPEITLVRVTGYADRLGKKRHNQILSEARANAVKAYLVTQGVAPGRILTAGMGNADPVSRCPKMARAKAIACLHADRRVEISPVQVEKRGA